MAPTRSTQIVAELRGRIVTGELVSGARVPSARQITREWGVAIATATKVLAALRDEGLVRAVPGVGTVVAAEPTAALPAVRARGRRGGIPPETALTRERITAVAIQIADAEGMAALSMRRVAAELGVATMSLYRHVASKEMLVVWMIDTIFAGEPLPDATGDWQIGLERLARLQWSLARRHPWLARATSFTRPQLAPRAMAHTEWALQAVSGLGLDPPTMLYLILTVVGFTIGTAVNLETETEAEQESGVSSSEWMEGKDPEFTSIAGSGQFPQLTRLAAIPGFDMELDVLFEFGLARVLDGLAAYVDGLSR